MMRRSGLGYLFALLAIAGFLLAPRMPSAAAFMTDHAMAMGGSAATADAGMLSPEDMQCCPGKAPIPDCSGDCPLMALCSAAPLTMPLASVIIPVAMTKILFPCDQSGLMGITLAPPFKPPKT